MSGTKRTINLEKKIEKGPSWDDVEAGDFVRVRDLGGEENVAVACPCSLGSSVAYMTRRGWDRIEVIDLLEIYANAEIKVS